MKKVHDRIIDMRGNLITVIAHNVSLGELAKIQKQDGRTVYASVLRIDGEKVTLQSFENTRGVATNDKVIFLGRQMQAICSDALLGRRLNGAGDPIDQGPAIQGDAVEIGSPSFNPVKRIIPRDLVRTNIPMIDVFNCLVKSQKIILGNKSLEEPRAFCLNQEANGRSKEITDEGDQLEPDI